MRKVVRVLTSARTKVKKGWTQFQPRKKDEDGTVLYCASGAVCASTRDHQLREAALQALADVMPYCKWDPVAPQFAVQAYNDNTLRTRGQVLKRFDAAIAKASKG